MIEMKFDAEFDMSKWLTQVKNKKLRDVLATAGTRGVAASGPIPRLVPGRLLLLGSIKSRRPSEVLRSFGTTQTSCPKFRLPSFCNTDTGLDKAATSRVKTTSTLR